MTRKTKDEMLELLRDREASIQNLNEKCRNVKDIHMIAMDTLAENYINQTAELSERVRLMESACETLTRHSDKVEAQNEKLITIAYRLSSRCESE